MTTFVKVTEVREDQIVRPAFVNLDHVFLLVPSDNNSSTWVRPVSQDRPSFTIRETPEELITGRIPAIPQWGGPPTINNLRRWTDQLAQAIKDHPSPSISQIRTKLLLNLEMIHALLMEEQS